MNKRRLMTLAKYLEKVPPKRFDMNRWVDGEFCGLDEEPAHDECGTTACAVGWAATIPSFKKAGLKINNRLDPQSGRRKNWAAVQAFFGDISEEQAMWLFSPEDPRYWCLSRPKETPKKVARRIVAFVKSDGKIPPLRRKLQP